MAGSGLESMFALFIERRVREDLYLFISIALDDERTDIGRARGERWVALLSLVHVYEMINPLVILPSTHCLLLSLTPTINAYLNLLTHSDVGECCSAVEDGALRRKVIS